MTPPPLFANDRTTWLQYADTLLDEGAPARDYLRALRVAEALRRRDTLVLVGRGTVTETTALNFPHLPSGATAMGTVTVTGDGPLLPVLPVTARSGAGGHRHFWGWSRGGKGLSGLRWLTEAGAQRLLSPLARPTLAHPSLFPGMGDALAWAFYRALWRGIEVQLREGRPWLITPERPGWGRPYPFG